MFKLSRTISRPNHTDWRLADKGHHNLVIGARNVSPISESLQKDVQIVSQLNTSQTRWIGYPYKCGYDRRFDQTKIFVEMWWQPWDSVLVQYIWPRITFTSRSNHLITDLSDLLYLIVRVNKNWLISLIAAKTQRRQGTDLTKETRFPKFSSKFHHPW